MQKPFAIFSGVLAAVTLIAGIAHPDPRQDGRRGEPPPRYGESGDAPRPPGNGYVRDSRESGSPGAEREQSRPTRPQANSPENYAQQTRPNSLGAGWRQQQEEARSGVRQGQMAPLGSVIAGIGRRSAGRPLDAGIEYQEGRAVYRVRWLTNDGRRVDYLVDAASGQIIGEH